MFSGVCFSHLRGEPLFVPRLLKYSSERFSKSNCHKRILRRITSTETQSTAGASSYLINMPTGVVRAARCPIASPASPVLPEGFIMRCPLRSICETLDSFFGGTDAKAHVSSDDDVPSAHSTTHWRQTTHSVTPTWQPDTWTGDPHDSGAETEPGCGAFA